MNTCPVILYPDGVQAGTVRSGKDRRGGRVRHVAITPDGARAGTFDTFQAAHDRLIELAHDDHR